MAVQTRTIKRRIKSVKNTRKITKAMELVSASKMRKAVNAVLSSRPYAALARETVAAVSRVSDTSLHPLLRSGGEVKRALVVVFASDRGLAGGFNVNVLRKTVATIHELGAVSVDAVCVGKRAIDAVRKAGKPIIAQFVDLSNTPRFEDILPVGRLIISEFTKGAYDAVLVISTDYVSALTQRPNVIELLPIRSQKTETAGQVEYAFEPSPTDVLNRMLPRLVETMVYQALLESAASEHASRMMAMRSASDAAGDMIDALTFTFNQARQAGITQEIAEISSGKAALEK